MRYRPSSNSWRFAPAFAKDTMAFPEFLDTALPIHVLDLYFVPQRFSLSSSDSGTGWHLVRAAHGQIHMAFPPGTGRRSTGHRSTRAFARPREITQTIT